MPKLDETHDPARRSWVESANDGATDFPIQNLPLGVFRNGGGARGGVAIGDRILDLAAALKAKLLSGDAKVAAEAASGPTLNPLMALGNRYASALRREVSDLLAADNPGRARLKEMGETLLVPMTKAQMQL
ncbi:MAG: hypothetical protein K2X74_12430, partial [Acetobacteraceae bacterium]|nr:hypothetical protein [Acetobacteraceae bacterium]